MATGNGAESARRAGYKGTTHVLSTQANRLLNRAVVKTALTKAQGTQAAMLIVAPVVLTVVVVVRIAEASESYLVWAVFAAMVVCGLTTVLQAARWGPLRLWARADHGHVRGAFIAVCVVALKSAGPLTLASLVVIASLFQFLLAARLSLLRRIFTPDVTGTVIMLIVAPVIYDTLGDVPEVADAATDHCRRQLQRDRKLGAAFEIEDSDHYLGEGSVERFATEVCGTTG